MSRKNKNCNNLIIFAEGTTSNGEGILSFKKGAFIVDSPLRIRSVKYKSRIHPGFVMLETIPLLVGVLCNTYIEVEVLELNVAVERGS